MNPFVAVAETDPEHACILAQAFVVAHTFDHVSAALRMVRKMWLVGDIIHGYIDGRCFHAWAHTYFEEWAPHHDLYEAIASDDCAFETLRTLADNFLEQEG